MSVVIAVCSQKGGSGKSTVVTGLADALIAARRRVCIIDADTPQHTLLRWYAEAQKLPRFAALSVEAALSADLHKRRWPAADVVLIDCAGRLDSVVRSAMAAADALLVPLQPTYPDSWALAGLAETVRAAVQARKRALPGFVVLNRIKPRTRLAKQADGLAQLLPVGFQLLDTRLRDLQAFQVAMGSGDTPLGLDPTGPAAADLRQLAGELLAQLRNHGQETRSSSSSAR